MLRRITCSLLSALALVGCASGSSGSNDGATEDTTGVTTDGAPTTGATSELVAFSAPVVGGGNLDVGATYAGRPLALWFWAPG